MFSILPNTIVSPKFYSFSNTSSFDATLRFCSVTLDYRIGNETRDVFVRHCGLKKVSAVDRKLITV